MGRAPSCIVHSLACAEIARHQFGLITRAQALAAGLSPSAIVRRLASGEWIQLLPAVYLLSGIPGSWEQRAMATALWAKGHVSHRSAARLMGWDIQRSGSIDVTTPRRMSVRNGIIVHRSVLAPYDRAVVRGIPITSPARILLDLGTCSDFDKHESLFEEALRRRHITMARARWELNQVAGPGVKGAASLRAIVEARPTDYRPMRSDLELRTLRALRRGGFPDPVHEFPVLLENGRTIRPDFAYPDDQTAIECESYTYHSGRKLWLRDIDRYGAIRRMGWTLIQVTDEILKSRIDEFYRDVRAALWRNQAG